MFFRRKRKPKDEETSPPDGYQRCQNPSCPTPEVYHPPTELRDLDGVPTCLFCLTRYRTEQEEEMGYQPRPTRRVDEPAIVRIPTTIHPTAEYGHLDSAGRIPSGDKTTQFEELAMWQVLVPLLGRQTSQELGSVREVRPLTYHGSPRLVVTDKTTLLVQITSATAFAFLTARDKLLDHVFGRAVELVNAAVADTPARVKSWVVDHLTPPGVTDQALFIVAHKVDGVLTPLEEFHTDEEDPAVLTTLAHSLGRWYYLWYLLGAEVEFYIVRRNSLVSFQPLNYQVGQVGEPFDQALVQSFVRSLPTTLPFLLDHEYQEAFEAGAVEGRDELRVLLGQSEVSNLVHELLGKVGKELKVLPDEWPELVLW